jgi:hypothetical protein
VENFARETGPRAVEKADAARKTADEARSKKQAERKAAQARKALEVRRQAEAQRAKALARIQAEATRAAEEEEMLARARREAEGTRANAETRRLIEEAEAARLRAEGMLNPDLHQAPEVAAETARSAVPPEIASEEQDRRPVQTQAEGADTAEHAPSVDLVEHRHRLKVLARVRDVRQARLVSHARRMAREAEAMRLKAEEAARTAFARSVESREARAKLVRLPRTRQERAEARARRLAYAADVERARAEQARLEAQARDPEAETAWNGSPNAERALGSTPEATTAAQGAAGAVPSMNGVRRVTVLMIMTPGTYGIRRGAKIADPVLCVIGGCYVSAGADRAARFLPRRKALGFGNTFGGRAGACRGSLGCVFRDVTLELPGVVQPVDLHILKHDRRRPQVITEDSDCGVAAERLTCNRPVSADDYVLWIMPERVAAMAGPDVLEQALADGLSPSRSARASGKVMRQHPLR